MKLFERLKRDPCAKCIYYSEENNTCQSKKCVTSNYHVNAIDKMFCEPLTPEENIGADER